MMKEAIPVTIRLPRRIEDSMVKVGVFFCSNFGGTTSILWSPMLVISG